MISKKMKTAVCLLSLTALLSVNNAHAGIGRLIFSKPVIFVAGVMAYPWLHKYFFISPEQRAALEQQAQQGENTQTNSDGEQNWASAWSDKLVQVACNIKDNSVLYWQQCRQQANDFLSRSQEELMLEETIALPGNQQEESTAETQLGQSEDGNN